MPVLVVVAFAVDFAVRRWVRPLEWPLREGLAAGIVLGGTVLILGGGLLLESGRFARESRAVARTIDFTAYEPRPLPPPFVLTSAEAGAGAGAPVIVTRYDAGTGYASVTQARPPGGARTPFNGRCVVAGSSRPCREVRTPKGIPVVMAEPYGPSFLDASAVLDGTLVQRPGLLARRAERARLLRFARAGRGRRARVQAGRLMSLLAQGGWFFNEWYWEPIFRTLKVLPFLGIVALVTAIVVRGCIPSLGHRVWVAMGIIVSGTALTLGLGLYGAYERPVHESAPSRARSASPPTSRARCRRRSSSRAHGPPTALARR